MNGIFATDLPNILRVVKITYFSYDILALNDMIHNVFDVIHERSLMGGRGELDA